MLILCVLLFCAAGPPGTLQADGTGQNDRAKLKRKLEDIVVPQIAFDEATVPQVVDFLERRSKELDPDGEGVNIVLRLRGKQAGPAGTGAANTVPTITMDMHKLPLRDVIHYMCMGAGLQYKLERHAVVITDADAALDTMETRFYSVYDHMFVGDGKPDVKKVLSNFGVDFPEGAKASYHAPKGKLAVTNTPRNLAKLERVLRELDCLAPTRK